MQQALALARKGNGLTSPNPKVGAVIVRNGKLIGEGWHKRAGLPHAEIEAIRAAERGGHSLEGSTLYVTLEPCSTFGRTPPCTSAILSHQFSRVVIGAVDPNPKHAGAGVRLLKRKGIRVETGLLAAEASKLNEAFNHWIVTKQPCVLLKAGMTLDGKLATRTGMSRWITSEQARKRAMQLRFEADAVLVGINTVLRDDPSLTLRMGKRVPAWKRLRRIVLDREANTPLKARLVTDEFHELTTIFVGEGASIRKMSQLEKRVRVVRTPLAQGKLDLKWIMRFLGAENVTSLMVEGGGETHAQFLKQRLGNRVEFFYAPKILGGRSAPKGVSGETLPEPVNLTDVDWLKVGPDLLLSACIAWDHD
jgi:diaminohydroxyphosphoribosylaminopyrimidine deaminase/5-amino-6-(5-phosphoribosylamino)uracil reductase